MKESKKNKVLERLFEQCRDSNNYVFDNDIIKEICLEVGFGNPFDVTKIDSKDKLPKILLDNNMAIVHLGGGQHKFIADINNVYHTFEKIQKSIDWSYIPSILNQYNTSESNILSVANNQRILHNFLFGKDIEFDNVAVEKRPKTYFPHRTQVNGIQIEVDLTIEYDGVIGVFEAKNGTPESFNVYQLYNPFLYYHKANQESSIMGRIKEVFCVYVVREHTIDGDIIKLWKYTFADPCDITSIELIDAASYKLIRK